MYITLVSFDNWGFNTHIASALEKKGHIVHHINFDEFKYKYPNFSYKIYNFFLKRLFKKNIKTIFFGKKIIEHLNKNTTKQDVILVIKGDYIDPKSILELKKYGKKTIAFFNDNTHKCPKIIRVIPYFDEVFSFEKKDCEKYNLKFATNWIYNSTAITPEKVIKQKVFTIISDDKRLSTLIKIASNLHAKNISHKIFVYNKKRKKRTGTIDYINKHVSLPEVNNHINSSQVLLDINRENQEGLTFRVFESIGLQKKLITTNSDIINYDFYNPNNILIIDKKRPDIISSFFDKEYEPLPESIFYKYSLDGWIENVIFNNSEHHV
jgi:hypothetical protein